MKLIGYSKNLIICKIYFFVLLIFFISTNTKANEEFSPSCPDTGEAITKPKDVSIDDLMINIETIVDNKGEKIIPTKVGTKNEFKRELIDVFKNTKTKMGQFYWMLYVMQKHLNLNNNNQGVEIKGENIKNILITAGVFKDDTFPNNISTFYLNKTSNKPHYRVLFKNSDISLPLNNGIGFYSFVDGKCQHLTHLKFGKGFSFSLHEEKNKNLVADNFENVEFVGDFGARGRFINIDLNYISLRRVEFIYGTTKGHVTAKISDNEFKINKHNFLLKLISKFVSNTTTQPIDW